MMADSFDNDNKFGLRGLILYNYVNLLKTFQFASYLFAHFFVDDCLPTAVKVYIFVGFC